MKSNANNVYALFLDMVKYEQNFGAYWIYLALIKGYLQKNDHPDRIYDVPFTEEELAKIKEMNEKDVLGINRVKLYATQVEGNQYALYFGRNPYETQTLHHKIYGVWATRWHSIYKQHQHTQVYLTGREEWVYMHQLKERVKTLPVCLGVVEVDKPLENEWTRA